MSAESLLSEQDSPSSFSSEPTTTRDTSLGAETPTSVSL